MTTNKVGAGAYRTDIDGLRAVAIMAVVLFHAHLAGFSGGFVGVDVFFVISGYLIGSIISREVHEQRFSFAVFYARRAKRILPALFFLLLCLYLFTSLVLTPAEWVNFGRTTLAAILAGSNILLWRGSDYFAPAAESNPMLMTWSLGVEEQFYLFFPVLLILLYRFKAPVFAALSLLCLGSLALSVKLTIDHPSAAFYMLPPRAWELGLGTLLAVTDSKLTRRLAAHSFINAALSVVGFLCLVVSVIFFTKNMQFPGYAVLLPTLGTAALIASKQGPINRWLLSQPPVVFIGLISYSWYLWHWPLLSLARVIANRPLSTAMSCSIVAASLIPAALSWRYIERPFRTAKTAVRPLLWSYATAVVAFLIPAALIVVNAGWPQRFAADVTRIEQAVNEEQTDACLQGYGVAQPNWSPLCVPHDAAANSVALLGDSHAAALAPAIRAIAAKQHVNFFQLSKASCPTLIDVSRYAPNHLNHDVECDQFNQLATQFIAKQPNIKVVAIAGFWAAPFVGEDAGQRFVRRGQVGAFVTPAQSEENLSYGLQLTVEFLLAAGKQVLIFKDVPQFNFNPASEVQTRFIPVRKLLMSALVSADVPYRLAAAQEALINDNSIVDAAMADLTLRYPAVVVVDPSLTLCHETGCRFADEQSTYYADSQHLSAAGAKYAVSEQLFGSHLVAGSE